MRTSASNLHTHSLLTLLPSLFILFFLLFFYSFFTLLILFFYFRLILWLSSFSLLLSFVFVLVVSVRSLSFRYCWCRQRCWRRFNWLYEFISIVILIFSLSLLVWVRLGMFVCTSCFLFFHILFLYFWNVTLF